MNSGNNEYSFLWFIENYSYCGLNWEEDLVSPDFPPEGLGGTSWALSLNPERLREGLNNSLYLKRSAHDAGPVNVSLKFEISVITADGSTLYSEECEDTFIRGDQRGFKPFLHMYELYVRRNTEYLPEDTLGVRCRMWKGEGSVHKVGQCTARTHIGIEKISFVHKVANFSAVELGEPNFLKIPSHSKKGCVFSSTLYVVSTYEGGNIIETVVDTEPYDCHYNLIRKKLSLLDVFGNTIECGEVDYRFVGFKEDVEKMRRSLTRKLFLNRRPEYLPNDELSLLCECSFSTGVEFNKIEDPHKDKYNVAEKLSVCSSVQDDFRTIYNDKLLTDMVLKTATKSFPTHKIVLCARSSVFKAMLTNDMKEKITDCIKLEDLENETVQQLLLFLYSDNLEELHWESALKLYYAADKYAVEKLKVLCSSFLVENLSTSTASELLLLADTHSDTDLKKFVVDFIFEHDEEVFGSDEWETLSETNPQLVMKIMKLKYKRKKGGK